MDETLEKLKEFKQMQEANLISDKEKIIDVIYYGKINLSNNEQEVTDENYEDLYLVKTQTNGKIEFEFKTNNGTIAKVGEQGEIQIQDNYKELINTKEFLLQLQKTMPLSLEKLEEIQKRKQDNTKYPFGERKDDIKKENNTKDEENKYEENSKDIKIDVNKKITETKTFKDLVPEVSQKGIVDIRIKRVDNTRFIFIGLNSEGQEIPLQTLEQTEGTNPNKEIVQVNSDGSTVKQSQVMTMLKIKNGENQGRQDEGFTINLGQYGMPEVNYYRRSPEENKYTSIPVTLKDTGPKRVEKNVREYIEKKRNTSVEDNIIRAEDRIEYDEDKETELENIDDNPYNDKVVDESEIIIRQAAKRCKVSVDSFKQQLAKADGSSLEEKIENTEEEINDQFRGFNDRRA